MRKFAFRKIKYMLIGVISLTAFIFAGCGRNPAKAFYGTFESTVDISGYVCERADEWMSTALMSELIDSDDIITDIRLSVTIKFNEDGTWSQTADESSYESAVADGYEKMEELVRQLLKLRLNGAGETGYDDDTLDELIEETLGMTLSEYVNEYVTDIIPSFEELSDIYNTEGRYEVTENVLLRDGIQEAYFAGDDTIVITAPVSGNAVWENDYPMILIKEGAVSPEPVQTENTETEQDKTDSDSGDEEPAEKEIIELN